MQPRIGEHVLPFIDLHYALALARHGDAAACDALQRSAWQHAVRATGRSRQAWIAAGLPVLGAVVAYGLGDRRRAAQGFERGLPALWRVGGSHQQRGLFHSLGADCPGTCRVATIGDDALSNA